MICLRLFVSVKQIGKKKPVIGEREIEIPQVSSLREIIEVLVEIEVTAYNTRIVDDANGDGRPLTLLSALSKDEIADGASVGKIAFGQRYNSREQKLDAAIENAAQSFEDGLYRAFVGDEEITKLDAPLTLADGGKLTFIRLTMLAGRLW